MDHLAAIQLLHDRHPRVVDPPGADTGPGALPLDLFWLQAHACELLDARSERGLRRCFATIDEVLRHGEPGVTRAVGEHFVRPHLARHPGLAWARAWMPPLLAGLLGVAGA